MRRSAVGFTLEVEDMSAEKETNAAKDDEEDGDDDEDKRRGDVCGPISQPKEPKSELQEE